MTPRTSNVALGCHCTMAMFRLSLSFQIVQDGVVASVTMRYATRDCGPSTVQLRTVELKLNPKFKCELRGLALDSLWQL